MYNLGIDYYQKLANGRANALSYFPQQNNKKKNNLEAINTQILYYFQSLVTNVLILSFNVINLLL